MATMKFFNVLDVPSEGAVDGTYYVKNGDYIDTYLVSSGKVERLSAESLMASYDGRVTQVESDISQLESEVSVKLNNLITNGNFANGTTGWYFGANISERSVADSILSFTGGGALSSSGSNWVSRVNVTMFPQGNILCNIATARSLMGAQFYVGVGYSQSFYDLTDQWETYSYLGSHHTHNHPNYGARLGDTVEMTNAMCFDLTEIFGAGNEPTKEEMDLLISTLGIDYFEGEITIPAQKVMQWQLKMIRQNRSAIVALGGTII